MTSQISSLSSEAAFNISAHLRQLEQNNQKLEESLRHQAQTLDIHMKLVNERVQLITPSLLSKIKQEQSLIHEKHSKRLLASQIKAQEGREMAELIKNYENRIMELQVALINKEAEIAEAAEDEGSDNLPRRENLRKLNIQCIQKNAIHRALQDLKKINVEITALEHSFKQKASQNKPPQNAKRKSHNSQAAQPQKPQVAGTQTLKEKISGMQKDKLLMKVYELLQAEVAKENSIRTELSHLKHDWESTAKAHKQLIRRYTREEKAITKRESKKHFTEDGERGLNFLEELERAERHPIDSSPLFHQVDLNIEKQKSKGERKRPGSRERHKVSKEN